MDNRSAMSAKIRAEFPEIRQALHEIDAPALHGWKSNPCELNWFLKDVLLSTRHGASIILGRSPGDANDPDQLHIEARVFWEGNGTEIRHINDMRAILWAHHGEQISFRSRSLFPTNGLHLSAPNLHELRIALTTHVRQAIRSYESLRHAAPA